jgi:hypothetical protein
MSPSLLPEIESILESNHLTYLAKLRLNYSATVRVFKTVDNTFSQVYGREGGDENVQPCGALEAIVVGDDFFPADARSAGAFKEGWLFTDMELIRVGNRVEIDREDCRNRRYEVISMQSIGTTRSVFKKYRLSALGD